jgi:inosine/xanthosine triphosphatase
MLYDTLVSRKSSENTFYKGQSSTNSWYTRDMKIGVGSMNAVKIQAVKDAVSLYPELFTTAEVSGVEVQVEEFGHPKNMEEVTQGAVDRAKQALIGNDFGFGLESGLVKVPHTRTGYLEIQMCAIYDGKNIYIGSSPGFEWPPKVTELIASGKADGSQAFRMAGFTQNEKQGAQKGGIIGILTKGRVPREDQLRYSIMMALVQLENPEMYA